MRSQTLTSCLANRTCRVVVTPDLRTPFPLVT